MTYRKPISKLELLFAIEAKRPYRFNFGSGWHDSHLGSDNTNKEHELTIMWADFQRDEPEVHREIDFPELEEDKDV